MELWSNLKPILVTNNGQTKTSFPLPQNPKQMPNTQYSILNIEYWVRGRGRVLSQRKDIIYKKVV